MNCVCGNCKYNECCNGVFFCNNEFGENYGVPTMYDDSCNDFEEKE